MISIADNTVTLHFNATTPPKVAPMLVMHQPKVLTGCTSFTYAVPQPTSLSIL